VLIVFASTTEPHLLVAEVLDVDYDLEGARRAPCRASSGAYSVAVVRGVSIVRKMAVTVGRLLGVLLIAVVMLIEHPILKWQDRRRYYSAAKRLGLNQGRVISKAVGAPFAQRGLTMYSIRPGDWRDVVERIRADARAVGYQDPPGENPPQDPWSTPSAEIAQEDLLFWPTPQRPPRDLRLNPPPGMPTLTLSAYAPGEKIRSETVPPGHTGLRIEL
jgi:hypothetical protein